LGGKEMRGRGKEGLTSNRAKRKKSCRREGEDVFLTLLGARLIRR